MVRRRLRQPLGLEIQSAPFVPGSIPGIAIRSRGHFQHTVRDMSPGQCFEVIQENAGFQGWQFLNSFDLEAIPDLNLHQVVDFATL